MRILLLFTLTLLSSVLKAEDCVSVADAPSTLVSQSQSAVDELLKKEEGPTCEVDSILNCSLFENSEEPYIDIGGGKSIPNLTVNGRPIESSEVSAEELAGGERAFQEVKSLILEEITRGKRPEELDSYSKILYDRVSTIKFAGLQECRTSRPNGQFNPESHDITICPGYLKMPATNLVRIFAHEISHSIDHCHMIGGFYHQHEENSYLSVSPKYQRLNLPQEQIQEKLLKGQIREIAAPQSPSDYPLLSQFNCLENRKGKERTVPGHNECSLDRTTAGEDSADLWAVKIVGKYLEKNPFNSEMEKQAFMFENIKSKCEPKVKSFKGNVHSKLDVHSSDQVRMNEIFLAHPSVQKAMNCKPKEHSCEVR